MKLFHKESKQKKETRSLPMGKKSRSAFAVYAALVLMLCCCTTTAFAASDPLTVINNLLSGNGKGQAAMGLPPHCRY